MTLDDAIRRERHAMRQSFGERSAEHRQLAEWLRELRDIKAENEKLWERVFELEELTDHRHYIPQEWYATLKVENAKLRELVSHLMYVKPVEVTAIAHDGKLLRFDEMLAEVGMRFEVEL